VGEAVFEGTSLRHMEPEHLSSPPREGHVPSPQEERATLRLHLSAAEGARYNPASDGYSSFGAERRMGRDSLWSLGSGLQLVLVVQGA
jgi:hypothetical protein